MPFRNWSCGNCGAVLKTKNPAPEHCGELCQPMLTAPKVKFMEKTDPDHGKSRLVGQEKILRERARNHSRTVEVTDLIEQNDLSIAHKNGWIREDGKVTKKLDDL